MENEKKHTAAAVTIIKVHAGADVYHTGFALPWS
jgi:hypothetical protein